jgi:hypothetical protein
MIMATLFYRFAPAGSSRRVARGVLLYVSAVALLDGFGTRCLTYCLLLPHFPSSIALQALSLVASGCVLVLFACHVVSMWLRDVRHFTFESAKGCVK